MVGGQRFVTVTSLHNWLKGRSATEKIAVMVRRFSGADARVTAEYHRFDIQPTDVRMITAGE